MYHSSFGSVSCCDGFTKRNVKTKINFVKKFTVVKKNLQNLYRFFYRRGLGSVGMVLVPAFMLKYQGVEESSRSQIGNYVDPCNSKVHILYGKRFLDFLILIFCKLYHTCVCLHCLEGFVLFLRSKF